LAAGIAGWAGLGPGTAGSSDHCGDVGVTVAPTAWAAAAVLGCAPVAACGLFQGPVVHDEQREQPDRSNCQGYHRKAERFNAASSHDKIKRLRARKVPFSPFDKVSPALALFCSYLIALFQIQKFKFIPKRLRLPRRAGKFRDQHMLRRFGQVTDEHR
jgi:hypothetical protein